MFAAVSGAVFVKSVWRDSRPEGGPAARAVSMWISLRIPHARGRDGGRLSSFRSSGRRIVRPDSWPALKLREVVRSFELVGIARRRMIRQIAIRERPGGELINKPARRGAFQRPFSRRLFSWDELQPGGDSSGNAFSKCQSNLLCAGCEVGSAKASRVLRNRVIASGGHTGNTVPPE